MLPAITLPLTAREALRLGSERLAKAGVESPQLDMSLLLAKTLGIDRLRLYADLDRVLTEEERVQARELLTRRISREPVAYLLGEKEFFGLAFEVNRETLIPRPETEHLVETAIAWLEERRGCAEKGDASPLLADIGTGSGAIAVAIAHRCPWTRWIATDSSAGALETARRNAKRHGVESGIDFRIGDLWAPIGEMLDGIASNPPYIAREQAAQLQPEVGRFEPAEALFADERGMSVLRALAEGAAHRLHPGGLLLLECGAGQAPAVAALIDATGGFEGIERIRDLAGIERVVRAKRNTDAAA